MRQRTKDDIRQTVINVLNDGGIIDQIVEHNDSKTAELVTKATKIVWDEYNATYASNTPDQQMLPSNEFIYGVGKSLLYVLVDNSTWWEEAS